MRRPHLVLALASTAGCAQVGGLDVTTARADAAIDAPRPRDAAIDAMRPCTGGTTAVIDPATGHCFIYHATAMPRAAARTTCESAGGYLATIASSAENVFVQNMIGMNMAFLGATDVATEGTYLWDDGTPVVLTNWNPMEPNNGQGAFEEDCMVMSGMAMGKWDDRPCAPGITTVVPGEYPLVCEHD